jgi:hypothetical protein
MRIKIENAATKPISPRALKIIEETFESLPWEHTKGLSRLKLVDAIVTDPRLRVPSDLPALYHPRQANTPAWIEIAVGKIHPSEASFFKKIAARLSLKSNLAALVFSLVGQHYYLTSRHSIKKGQLEGLVKDYTEKRFRAWAEQKQNWRTKLIKPFQPKLEGWAKALQRRAAQTQKKSR